MARKLTLVKDNNRCAAACVSNVSSPSEAGMGPSKVNAGLAHIS